MRSDLLAHERRARSRRRVLAAAGLVFVAIGIGAAVRQGWFLRGHPDRVATSLVVLGDGKVATSSPPSSGDGADRGEEPDSTDAFGIRGEGGRDGVARATTTLRTRPISDWLADVADEARCDLVLSPDLRGDLTASESEGLGWEQRLDAYARVFGFDYDVGDGLLEVRRGGGGAASDSPRLVAGGSDFDDGSIADGPTEGMPEPEPPPQTRVIRLAHESAGEAASVLAKAARALDVTVSADASSNALVLSGQPGALHRVAAVLGELDKPRRRILLEVKMVEVLRSARLDLGVEWKVTGSTVGGDVSFPPPATDAGSAALLIATHGATALDARISALEAGGKLRVVSRPSVVMLEGSPATIESVRILRIRLPSNGTVVGDEVTTGTSSGRATEDIPVGVRLEVTPAIRGGGRVLLRVRAKSSSLGQPLPPDNIPEELSRMVDAEVFVTSGETAVLGGLSRESGSDGGAGVPGLRKVPLLGRLFGRKTTTSEEEELVVLVTPKVLDEAAGEN